MRQERTVTEVYDDLCGTLRPHSGPTSSDPGPRRRRPRPRSRTSFSGGMRAKVGEGGILFLALLAKIQGRYGTQNARSNHLRGIDGTSLFRTGTTGSYPGEVDPTSSWHLLLDPPSVRGISEPVLRLVPGRRGVSVPTSRGPETRERDIGPSVWTRILSVDFSPVPPEATRSVPRSVSSDRPMWQSRDCPLTLTSVIQITIGVKYYPFVRSW